jgi:tRNA (guanine-N7-)-methyltransferase
LKLIHDQIWTFNQHILTFPYLCTPMAQKKLIRFAAIKTFANVLEYPSGMAGQWHGFFNNHQPIVLELACGRGEYTVGLSRLHPHRNHIGVDIKGNRLYIGAKKCLEEGLRNAAFLRTQIEKIDQYFAPGEVDEIWITFPDPQLRISKAKKRLTHPRFLRLYQRIMKPGGKIHLKTDSPQLYRFTLLVAQLYGLNVLEANENIYAQPIVPDVLKINTYYEGLDIAQSNQIHYLCVNLPKDIVNIDEALQQTIKDEEEFG